MAARHMGPSSKRVCAQARPCTEGTHVAPRARIGNHPAAQAPLPAARPHGRRGTAALPAVIVLALVAGIICALRGCPREIEVIAGMTPHTRAFVSSTGTLSADGD